MAFVTDGQSTVAEQPGDSAFQSPTRCLPSVGDFSLAPSSAELGDVVGLIGMEFG